MVKHCNTSKCNDDDVHPKTNLPSPTTHATCNHFSKTKNSGKTCCAEKAPDEILLAARNALAGMFNKCESCAKAWERIVCALACSPKQGAFVKPDIGTKLDQKHISHLANVTYKLKMHVLTAVALWESCSSDDYMTPAKVKGAMPEVTGFRVRFGGGSEITPGSFIPIETQATNFVESPDYVRLFLPGVESRVVVEVTCKDDPYECHEGLTEHELGYDSGYGEPKPYHIAPYCSSDVDMIKETSMQILARVAMLLIGSLVGNFLHKKHFHYLPESGVFIILGCIFGAIMLAARGQSAASSMKFDADFLTLCLLPPIIFYSGYCMPSISNFMYNAREILVLAGVGTIMSTLITGYGLYWCRSVGDHSLYMSITIWECLAFAALISAVDPVATLATFSSLQVDPDLEVLVFGEALLNDAVAIVLYKSFAKFAKYGGPSVYFSWGDMATKFFALVFGSIGVGILCGMAQALVFKYVFFKHTEVLEAVVFLTLAYSSFLIAEWFHFSGIIASLLHGMMAATFVKNNMSASGHTRAFILTNMLASFSDMMIFIMTGIIATVGVINDVSYSFTGFTMLFILVGRFLAVFTLIPLLNLCRSKERVIGWGKAAAMWYAGLRGAIAVGLVVGIPTALRHMMLSTTVVIVLVTVFFMGGTTAAFLKLMGIQMGKAATKDYEVPAISPKLRQASIRMQKILCNYDEDGDGVDDRYQTDEYIKNSHTAEADDASHQIMGGYAHAEEDDVPSSKSGPPEAGVVQEQLGADENDPVRLKEKKRREIQAWADVADVDSGQADGKSLTKVTPVNNLEDSQNGK
jgi:sodium/hydrogen exchanger 8